MKIFTPLLILVWIFTSCQPTENSSVQIVSSFDQAVIEKEVGKVADKYFKIYKNLDVEALDNLLTEDCITMGTDPSESWNKTTIIQKIKDLKANPQSVDFVNKLTFDLVERKVQISQNGTQATVTDHSKVSFSKMLIRRTTKLKKIGADWKINYINTALVANNFNLPKVKKVNEKI